MLGQRHFLGKKVKHADVHPEQHNLREKTNPQLWLENKPALGSAAFHITGANEQVLECSHCSDMCNLDPSRGLLFPCKRPI